jgi:hypothetical protein
MQKLQSNFGSKTVGRPMWEKLEEKYLECLVLNDMGANDHGMFQKIIRA